MKINRLVDKCTEEEEKADEKAGTFRFVLCVNIGNTATEEVF